MTPPVDRKVARLRRASFALFTLLSILTFAGPLLILVVGKGGESPTYPPDRPIEWRVFVGVIVLYVVLLALTLGVTNLLLRELRKPPSGP
jgi:uncharacterized membrane protein YhaH (DUF805 family)